MHEYSIVQAMFDRIGEIVDANGARSVKRVRVRIGRFAGVEPELFRTAYDVYRVRTFCDEAPLEIAESGNDELMLDQVELEVD
ncbi:MAG TPA: hydrogenase maturation nickel metallochaperone HypA [Vicinamibacterales bacterium]|nr:hydrogenase maturation nickel metallochaperone HypA [Vicinamibacterales bacterium]